MNLESLRDVMLSSCGEFNNKYFFVALQCALLVYYPSIALSIIYQSYDLEMQSDEEQQDVIQQSQDMTSCIKPQQQSSSISQQSFVQFIQLLQRLISEFMRCDTDTDTLYDSQPQLQLQQFMNMYEQRVTQRKNEIGAVRVEVALKPHQEEEEEEEKKVQYHPCYRKSTFQSTNRETVSVSTECIYLWFAVVCR
eukprot:TRINITY_DN4378_c0_g1_i1.p1 TRINITY_DN4378_c0_g1~~TRINITY_DN4378_c0_g1_i1.p1  ORF type:complete len:194 (+),score=51.04 TRINITY_DN4378_c0_g1_i1:102-683(+)